MKLYIETLVFLYLCCRASVLFACLRLTAWFGAARGSSHTTCHKSCCDEFCMDAPWRISEPHLEPTVTNNCQAQVRHALHSHSQATEPSRSGTLTLAGAAGLDLLLSASE